MNAIWAEIEKLTDYKRNDYLEYNFGGGKYAKINVEGFTDTEARELASSELDENGEILKNRKYKVNYKSLDLGLVHNKDNILITK